MSRAMFLLLALCIAAPAAGTEAEAPKKTSPYVEANKRHIDSKTGKHEPTMKRAAASGRAHASPIRRKR